MYVQIVTVYKYVLSLTCFCHIRDLKLNQSQPAITKLYTKFPGFDKWIKWDFTKILEPVHVLQRKADADDGGIVRSVRVSNLWCGMPLKPKMQYLVSLKKIVFVFVNHCQYWSTAMFVGSVRSLEDDKSHLVAGLTTGPSVWILPYLQDCYRGCHRNPRILGMLNPL